MLTEKQETVLLKKIKSLTEIEFTMLMEGVAEHVSSNRWAHVIASSFSDFEPGEFEDMEDQLDAMTDKKDRLVDVIESAVDALDDIEMIDDDEQKKLDKIIESLRWSI